MGHWREQTFRRMLSSLSMIWFTMDFLRGMKCECLRLLATGLSGVWIPDVAASEESSRAAKVNGAAQLKFDGIVMLGGGPAVENPAQLCIYRVKNEVAKSECQNCHMKANSKQNSEKVGRGRSVGGDWPPGLGSGTWG